MVESDNNVNNKAYLDICEEFKIVVDDKDKQIKTVRKNFNEFYKSAVAILGLVRIIEPEIEYDDHFELEFLVQKLLSSLDELLFKHLENN